MARKLVKSCKSHQARPGGDDVQINNKLCPESLWNKFWQRCHTYNLTIIPETVGT